MELKHTCFQSLYSFSASSEAHPMPHKFTTQLVQAPPRAAASPQEKITFSSFVTAYIIICFFQFCFRNISCFYNVITILRLTQSISVFVLWHILQQTGGIPHSYQITTAHILLYLKIRTRQGQKIEYHYPYSSHGCRKRQLRKEFANKIIAKRIKT